MQWFECWGDYGVHSSDYVSRYILAKDSERAITIFAEWLKKNEAYLWKRIGYGNINIQRVN